MKKILSLLLVIAMMVTLAVTVSAEETTAYDLYVGGVQITDANKDDIVTAINDAANATVATGLATYDPDTKTLTLNNFSYTGEGRVTQYYNAAISTNSINLNVNLLGTNTITCQSNDESVKCYAIYVMENQHGSGYLTISGTDKETDKLICTANDGINSRRSLTVEDATVQTNGAQICSQFGDITLTDSIVSANVKAGSNLTVENSKLESFTTLGAEDSFTITNSTVTGGGLNASDDASKITVTGSQVNVTAIDAYDIVIEGNSNVTAQAICVYQGLNVKDSSVHVTGGKIPGLQLDGNFGILSYIIKAKVRIDNSTVEVYGGSGAYLYVNYNQTTFESIVPLFVDGEELADPDDYTVIAGDDAESAVKVDSPTDATYASKYVKIMPSKIRSTTVTYEVAPTYTVTIPATVALGETATIKAENVVVAKGKQVEVALTNANGFTVATPQGAKLGYTVKNGETTVNEGDTVLTVNPEGGKTGETTLTFTTPETVKFAGDYTGTVTFTIAVNTAEDTE